MNNIPLRNFCGHLAYLLNTPVEGEAYVELEPFRLQEAILKVLAHKHDYRIQIVGMPRMGGLCETNPDDREEAALRWVDAVLDRPMQAKAGYDGAKSHALARALRARAAISERRAVHRPLPDKLSVLEALRRAPQRMHILKDSEKNAFTHLVIQAVEAANVCWGRLNLIGLAPDEWCEHVPVNQAKTLGAFVLRARKVERSAWPDIWATHSVTRFKTLEAFLASDLGRAARRVIEDPAAARPDAHVYFDDQRDQPEQDDIGPNFDQAETAAHAAEILRVLEEQGDITAFERRLLEEVQSGGSLEEIFNKPWVREQHKILKSLINHTDMLYPRISKSVEAMTRDSPGGTPLKCGD